MNIIPATEEMMRQLYPEITTSVKAIVAEENGKVFGVVGVCPDKQSGQQWMFMSLTEEIKKRPRILIQAWRKVSVWVKNSPLPTRALCDESIEAADRYLLHFGFKPLTNGVYEWVG